MRIIVSQQDERIKATFKQGRVVDNYVIDKADEFLAVLDKFLKKNSIRPIGQIGPIGNIKFQNNTGLLTERIIRATIAGLRF